MEIDGEFAVQPHSLLPRDYKEVRGQLHALVILSLTKESPVCTE